MHFRTSTLRIFYSMLLCAISSHSARLSGGEFHTGLNYSKVFSVSSDSMAKSPTISLNNGNEMPIIGLGENFETFS